ncbi:MAG: nitroreductase family protein [Burkholderiales bacterium]|nr:nitroreductase family protein [Burkholderiales bacterium]
MTSSDKVALDLMGLLRPKAGSGARSDVITLPAPQREGGMPVMEALAARATRREFARRALPDDVLSNLLWAAFGINRPASDGRTAPSALNQQEIDIYAALPNGLYRYDPHGHCLLLVAPHDVRCLTGVQQLVDDAPLDLVYVADHNRMMLVPTAERDTLAAASAGAIAENVYLYAASAGLATVLRTLIDRDTLSRAMNLEPTQRVVLAQTVGYPLLAQTAP